MDLHFPPSGCYVVAVSGGLDSVSLLDILAKQSNYNLTVAHFDHGMREDSRLDYLFVKSLAKKYGLRFIGARAELGKEASEATARMARYDFLFDAIDKTYAKGIVTAHHQDDRLETLFINLIRGTGRKGIGSIREQKNIFRPLLNVTRKQLESYVLTCGLVWRDDPTNFQDRYLRNRIRHQLLPKLSLLQRQELVALMDAQAEINKQIDDLLKALLNYEDIRRLNKQTLSQLSYKESREVVATWLRENNLVNFDHRTIERLTVAAKTKPAGTKIDVYGTARVKVEKEFLALSYQER
jgi:tRNA(Ile)-lysidine synthase